MSWKLILRLAELTISAILATSLFLAWRAERSDRAKLATELAVAQQCRRRTHLTRGEMEMRRDIALAIARSDLISRNVTATLQLETKGASVFADPVQLQQVILNLIVNACDAMADGPGAGVFDDCMAGDPRQSYIQKHQVDLIRVRAEQLYRGRAVNRLNYLEAILSKHL